MAIRMLEAKAAFAEVHLARNAGFFHPQQGAVDGGAADAVIFAFDQLDQIISAQVSLLLEERVDDQIPLAGTLGAGRPETIEIRNGRAGGHDLERLLLTPRTMNRSRRWTSRSDS